MQFFISKQWINRFNTFAEPGPITNDDFLCPHGGKENKWFLTQDKWKFWYSNVLFPIFTVPHSEQY